MKLFNKDDTLKVELSQETFTNLYTSSKVVSTEAIGDYLFKLRDSINSTHARFIDNSKDIASVELVNTRLETEHVVKRLDFVEFRHAALSKPENFYGRYVDYIKDLTDTSDVIVKDVKVSLANLKLAVASFINEHRDSKLGGLYGYEYFKTSERLVDNHTKVISKYFPKKDSSVKTRASDVLKNLSDVPTIYTHVFELTNILNTPTIEEISKLVKDVSLLVDSLIEQNNNSGVLIKANKTKKELIESLHIVGKEVEFVGYLYTNALLFYTAVKSLSNEIIKAG